MKYEQMASLPTLPELKAMQNANAFNKKVQLKQQITKKYHNNGLIKDGDFDYKLTFDLKVINLFAMMCYDVCFELKDTIKKYNIENNRNFILSNKFVQSIKKMEDCRKRLEHHSLEATQEFVKIFEGIQDKDNNVKSLDYLFEIVDTYEFFLQLYAFLVLECGENLKELKKLFGNLKKLLKTKDINIKEPDWEALSKTSKTVKNAE